MATGESQKLLQVRADAAATDAVEAEEEEEARLAAAVAERQLVAEQCHREAAAATRRLHAANEELSQLQQRLQTARSARLCGDAHQFEAYRDKYEKYAPRYWRCVVCGKELD